MATNSNCGSLGPNSTEYDHQNANAKLVERIELPHENGAANSLVGYSANPRIELPLERDAMDSNQQHKKPELENCDVNSDVGEMTLPPGFETANSTVGYSSQLPNKITGNLCPQQLKETHTYAIGNPSGTLMRRNENNEKQAEMPSKHKFLRPPLEDLTLNLRSKNVEFPPENERAYSVADPAEPPGFESHNRGHRLRGTCKDANKSPAQLEHEEKGPPESISTSRTDVNTTRVLRPKTHKQSESPIPNDAAAGDSDDGKNSRTRRKEKQKKQNAVNEFSSIRTKLRYLLHRIKYEQNLIDAYSGEGWKGKSIEKIKPEKELQRAKSGIFTYKLKIRDLFQRIDMMLAHGRLPESSFDSKGLIDSEDIFCAKCGSKDLPADNDIILCDGACERGFHQFCLEPPLLKEDIPPGDEVWLCPGCVCKLDCFVLLNDLLGTNLSLPDSWEKVFPEEAASVVSGKKLDDVSGLLSDDSEDDDYNPDHLEVEENGSGNESASEESDYFSASDDLAAPVNNDQLTGLPSDDSEDDDYDPDAPDHDAQVMQENSNSDFTSDSEDVGPEVNDTKTPSQDQCGETKIGGVVQHSLNDELSYQQSNDDLVSQKRYGEGLDYKKSNDEAHQSTSSDYCDEEYGCTAPKRKNRSHKAAHKSSDQAAIGVMNTNFNQSETEHTTERRSRKRLKVEGSVTPEQGSSSKKNTKSRYGEDVIKRLFESFKENQYPKREVKESLATELGLTAQQVSKWFENARRSFHHSSSNQPKNQS
nr:pathogenesis-related homeodomain protein [Ipomoea batatas]